MTMLPRSTIQRTFPIRLSRDQGPWKYSRIFLITLTHRYKRPPGPITQMGFHLLLFTGCNSDSVLLVAFHFVKRIYVVHAGREVFAWELNEMRWWGTWGLVGIARRLVFKPVAGLRRTSGKPSRLETRRDRRGLCSTWSSTYKKFLLLEEFRLSQYSTLWNTRMNWIQYSAVKRGQLQ